MDGLGVGQEEELRRILRDRETANREYIERAEDSAVIRYDIACIIIPRHCFSQERK